MKPAVACLAVASLTACGTESASSPFSERDSAGVRIVENHATAISAGWTLTEQPVVQIGATEGDSSQLLHNVRGALALGDGRIVVVNGAAPMLRWFDAQGKYLQGAGRTGGGPGEFESLEGGAGNIHSVWPLGADSVATWEHSPRRMQVFDGQARFARAVTLESPAQTGLPGYPQLIGRLGQQDFIAFHAPHRESVTPGVIWRDTMRYTWWSQDGKYTGNSVQLPGFDYAMSEFRGRKYAGRPPFARVPVAWADSSRLYYGAGDRFEIAIYDSAARLNMLIRRDAPRRAITEAIKTSYVAERMKEAPKDPVMQREWESGLRQALFPDSVPAYRRIRVDRTGALWVQNYDIPGDTTVTWHVFDRAGRWLSDLAIPRTWVIQDIGRDYLLVLARNELDVEMVRQYGLQRGQAK